MHHQFHTFKLNSYKMFLLNSRSYIYIETFAYLIKKYLQNKPHNTHLGDSNIIRGLLIVKGVNFNLSNQ